MAKKQRDRSELNELHPEVLQLSKESLEQQAAQATDGRGRPGHAGQKGVDKRGHQKATYYIPVERQDLVREMAKAEDVSQGDMIELAIVSLYNAWRAGKLDLDDLKHPKKSLHVMWELRVPDEFNFFLD